MKRIVYITILVLSGCYFASCDHFLDREPLSVVAPEDYFSDASQLQNYLNGMYTSILPSHSNWSYGIFGEDNNTDNQTGAVADNRYADGLWKVPNSDDDNWEFEWIYRCNYFLSNVLEKYGNDLNGTQNKIAGDLNQIKHYIGEAYFLRACEYFKRYQKFGDFPIITEPLSDDMETLCEANKRMPRSKVARFILEDLDNAYEFLSAIDMSKTRINKDVALLLKSRVALFEGTWLKYFRDTPFVPNGPNWPGALKDYNADFQYESGNIDNEINFFLDEAIKSSEIVAEIYKGDLTVNTGKLQQSVNDPINPYYNMFAQEDLSSVSEVLLWRQYARGLETHNVNVVAGQGNNRIGVTRGLVNNFLMIDGTPIYKHGTCVDGDGYYMGDKTISDVRKNRDTRLAIFLKEPGQKNILYENVEGTNAVMVEPYPRITLNEQGYVTGYALRKGGSFDQKHYVNGGGYTGAICYRASEALLNYMEAYYERYGNRGGHVDEYWNLLRQRAGITGTIDFTIVSTDMEEESSYDWGAYSGGKILTDKVLYNIRRERRCELMAEGLRYMDLCRWRAMDQMITTPYFIEGMHLWNTPMEHWYDDPGDDAPLLADGSAEATVSSVEKSEYIRPYQKNANQICYDGYIWHLAHYLNPIPVNQFLVTSVDGQSIETSPLYQNPYWLVVADMPAEQ